MRRPRIGLIVPFVPFYEGIVSLRAEKSLFAEDVGHALRQECDVVDAGLVESEEQAREVGERFAGAKVDGVVIAPALAAFGALGWRAVERLTSTPIAIWHVPLADTVPEGYDIKALIRHSGGLSVMAVANTLARNRRPFRVVHAPLPSRGEAIPPVFRQFCRAARAGAFVRSGTLLKVGSEFPSMTDVVMDPGAWRSTMGRVVEIAAVELHERFASIDPRSVDARTANCALLKGNDPAISDEELARSIRLALALESIVVEYNAIGGAFNCHGHNCLQNPSIGVTGCLGVSWMTGSGRPFSCTGDLPTAVALIVAKQLSGTAIYAELDFVDALRNRLLLANGGEGDVGADGGGYSIFPNENFAGLAGRGAAIAVPLATGPATLISFTPIDGATAAGGYRIVAALGQLEEEGRSALRGFHAAFRICGMRAREAFTQWCEAGATHHLAVATGQWSWAIRLLAEVCQWEVRIIGNEARETERWSG